MPFPGRAPLPPGEGPPRPPLPPPRPVMAPPVPHPHQAPVQGRAPPVPWSEGDVRPPAPRPVLNGEAHAPYPSLGPAPPAAKPAKGPRPPATPRGAHGERGPLVENIPRRMRVAVPAGGEVRIARDRIAALMQALNGAGVPQRGAPVARALTVRLRAPNGGFTIEATAPETQWVESASSLIRDDDAIWSWTVVPQRRGRGRLLLMVSARSIGPDGAGAETAPPDRVIDVRVRGNFGRALARWTGLLLALSGGVLLGRFGEALVPALVVTFREISGF
jgi:neural Wiskott-Aldrich syndrome protein